MGKNKEIIDKVITLCEEKNYNKESAFNLVLICCSSQMLENGYTSQDALSKAIEYINESKNSGEAIYKLLKLAGYKN